MTEGSKPARRGGWRRPPVPKTPEEQRAYLEIGYLQQREEQIAVNDRRAYEDIRIRRDGHPSAVPPSPTLPLRLWAVIEDVPDGDEYDGVGERLRAYRAWMVVLRRNGLYNGPTDLKRVNGEEDDGSQE
jgi:hypothetical protein